MSKGHCDSAKEKQSSLKLEVSRDPTAEVPPDSLLWVGALTSDGSSNPQSCWGSFWFPMKSNQKESSEKKVLCKYCFEQ